MLHNYCNIIQLRSAVPFSKASTNKRTIFGALFLCLRSKANIGSNPRPIRLRSDRAGIHLCEGSACLQAAWGVGRAPMNRTGARGTENRYLCLHIEYPFSTISLLFELYDIKYFHYEGAKNKHVYEVE